MVEISTAIAGIKVLRDFGSWVLEKTRDAEIQRRVAEFSQKLGDVQDKLHELREENIALLEEKRELTEQLRVSHDRGARRAHYKLVETPGGATVLAFDGHDGTLNHFVCPACAESRGELHPLQDKGLSNGVFECPSCNKDYSVNSVRSQSAGPLYLR